MINRQEWGRGKSGACSLADFVWRSVWFQKAFVVCSVVLSRCRGACFPVIPLLSELLLGIRGYFKRVSQVILHKGPSALSVLGKYLVFHVAEVSL